MAARVLIFANGDVNDGLMVRSALAAADEYTYVIAADGGARVARYYGFEVDLVIGDMDSLDEDELQQFIDAGAEVERHSPQKDETDLELALYAAAEREAEWVRIIGGIGGRMDQTIANIYLLGLAVLDDIDVSIVAGDQEMWILRCCDHGLSGTPGDTISLIPVGGPVHGVTTEGLYYPLKNETLEFGPARGISNVLVGRHGRLTAREGVLLVIHTVGRAE